MNKDKSVFSRYRLDWLRGAINGLYNVDDKAFRNNKSALFLAAKGGDIDRCRYLLRRGYDINSEDPFNQTPLYSAIQSRDVECCKFLIKKGANVNHQDFNDNTPLIKAISMNELDIMAILLGGGADPNKPSKDGSPLYIAYCEENLKAARLLIRYGAISIWDVVTKKGEE